MTIFASRLSLTLRPPPRVRTSAPVNVTSDDKRVKVTWHEPAVVEFVGAWSPFATLRSTSRLTMPPGYNVVG